MKKDELRKRYIKEELERLEKEKNKDNKLNFWYKTSTKELFEIRNTVNRRIEREERSNPNEKLLI